MEDKEVLFTKNDRVVTVRDKHQFSLDHFAMCNKKATFLTEYEDIAVLAGDEVGLFTWPLECLKPLAPADTTVDDLMKIINEQINKLIDGVQKWDLKDGRIAPCDDGSYMIFLMMTKIVSEIQILVRDHLEQNAKHYTK